jgi:hypothetical protein
MDSCKSLMWEQQLHCQISLQLAAEELFNSLDERLIPKVFMLGIKIKGKQEVFVNLECKDCNYSATDFNSLKSIPLQFSNSLKDKPDNPLKNEVSSDLATALRLEIQKILRQHPKCKAIESFLSPPAFINGYLVFIITELNKTVMDSFYSLTKDYSSAYNGLRMSRSFMESIIKIYLHASTNALKAKSQSEFNILSKSRDEMVSNAAQDFMYTIASAGHNSNDLQLLYDACNTISSLKYEGEEGLGKMIIAARDHCNVKINMELEEPIHIKDFRKVRKFLELANNDHLLISDAVYIYGLGKLTGKYLQQDESLFIIHFTKHFHWEVVHHDKIMISVSFRMPGLYNEKINKYKFYTTFARIFKDLNKEKLNRLWGLTVEATKQKHGTILAVSTAAEEEAERLGKQSFKIKPMVLKKELIHQITSIDGAVLLDTNCNCFAIGVILDGIASTSGDSSRGARYNSAIKYYEVIEKKAGIVLIVISEDGMINLIPDLKPQIRHKDISNKIEEFKSLDLTDSKDRRQFNLLMSFFDQNSFYFSPEECEIINDSKSRMENKHRFLEGINMIYDKFEPNLKMNNSYYLKE